MEQKTVKELKGRLMKYCLEDCEGDKKLAALMTQVEFNRIGLNTLHKILIDKRIANKEELDDAVDKELEDWVEALETNK